MRLPSIALAGAIAVSAPLAAFAQQHRSAPPAARPAAARASAPQTRAAAPPRGFDLHEDMHPPRQPSTPTRPSAPINRNRPVTIVHQPTLNRPALIGRLGYGGQPGGHRMIANPRYHGPIWGWNHGIVWNPAPRYWGGGFWGSFVIDAGVGAFGSIYYDDETLSSYQVEPDTPGAQLLMNYQLTQVPCGAPNLVVIFGLDNSVICADPNDLVAAGEYQLDPSELTIVSLAQ